MTENISVRLEILSSSIFFRLKNLLFGMVLIDCTARAISKACLLKIKISVVERYKLNEVIFSSIYKYIYKPFKRRK